MPDRKEQFTRLYKLTLDIKANSTNLSTPKGGYPLRVPFPLNDIEQGPGSMEPLTTRPFDCLAFLHLKEYDPCMGCLYRIILKGMRTIAP